MQHTRENDLMHMYARMLAHFGQSHWWPGEHPFEVAVGAILTQNTMWRNVEKALALLREANALSPLAMWNMPERQLEEAIRPSGFFRQKTIKLRNLLCYFAEAAEQAAPPDDKELTFLQYKDTEELREDLLGIRGVGPETADSILLYALGRPAFVVDAYTRRIYSRHGFLPDDVDYAELREFFTDVLPEDVALFNEYHALIVRTGNTYCKKGTPLCAACPLGDLLNA